MSFKRRNPWTAKNEEIARLKALLQDKKDEPIIRSFVDAFLHNLGVLLATKPFEEWPQEAKVAFEWEAKEAPTVAQMYLERLRIGVQPLNSKIGA